MTSRRHRRTTLFSLFVVGLVVWLNSYTFGLNINYINQPQNEEPAETGQQEKEQQEQGLSSYNYHRDPKMMYLPFIKVVVPPEPCGGDVNGVRDGQCFPLGVCAIEKGQRSGECSLGFGECCRIYANCTADMPSVVTDESVVVLRTPEPSTTQCSFKIRKRKDVCQLRLDFKTFTTTSANGDGICEMDRFTISNSITVPDGFTTCGELRDQHMYLSFGSSDSIDITPRLLSPNSRYEIVVSQIPCLSRRVVPSYCLQYFNRSTAVVRSFDYPNQQQSLQQYTVCVESTEQSKSVTWRPCTTADFGVGTGVGKPFQVTTSLIGIPKTCDTDWVAINGEQRHCGEVFPNMVRSTWKPYLLNVHFDERERPIFPFGPNPAFISSSNDCGALGLGSGLFTCEWEPTIPSAVNPNGTCHCDIRPELLIIPGFNPAILFGPPPDILNAGFCLRYET